VSGLATLPVCQGDVYSSIAVASQSQPHAAVQPPPRGLGGAAAHIHWWPYTLVYCPGPLHALGRDHSPPLYDGREPCGRPDRRLGHMLWHPRANHFRPWPVVLVYTLGCTYPPPGREDALHHPLPPPIEWGGGAVSLSPQGLPASAAGWRRLARTPALGVASALSRPEQRLRCVGGRIPIQFSVVLTGPIPLAYEPPPSSFIRQLQSSVPCVANKSGCSSPPQPPPAALLSAWFVYVRLPPLSPSLAPSYSGPYWVSESSSFRPQGWGGGGTVEAPARLGVSRKSASPCIVNL
jgi:hypothetical protein